MTKTFRTVGAVAVLFLTAAVSQLLGQDRVEYTDPSDKKAKVLVGDIKEDTPAGVKVLAGKKQEAIAAGDINRVAYADLPAVLKLEYGGIPISEDKKDYAGALKGYKEILPKVPPKTNTRRNIEYRIAMLSAQLAEKSEEVDDALDALKKYVADYPNGWQFSSAAKTLARMQISAEKYDDALQTLEALGKVAGIPKELQQEAELMTIDVLIRNDKLSDAASKIASAINSLPPGDSQRKRLEIYQLAADDKAKPEEKIKSLDAIIASTTDEGIRALAFNTLGDCHQKIKPGSRDAMWSYLWVDVVYNKDKTEHLKAIDRLQRLFTEIGDLDRAAQYKEKLARLR